MIYQELIKSLQQLTLPREFSYLPSSTSSEKNVYVLLSVSENEIKARRAGDIAECYADPSKAEKELGWKAVNGIKEMCEDSWRWQHNNPNGYN